MQEDSPCVYCFEPLVAATLTATMACHSSHCSHYRCMLAYANVQNRTLLRLSPDQVESYYSRNRMLCMQCKQGTVHYQPVISVYEQRLSAINEIRTSLGLQAEQAVFPTQGVLDDTHPWGAANPIEWLEPGTIFHPLLKSGYLKVI